MDAVTVIEKTCHKIGKSKPESSEVIDTSGGLVGQVISFLFVLLLNDFLSGLLLKMLRFYLSFLRQ